MQAAANTVAIETPATTVKMTTDTTRVSKLPKLS